MYIVGRKLEIEEKGMKVKSFSVKDHKSLELYENILKALGVNFSNRIEQLILEDLERLITIIELVKKEGVKE
jgi:hypothetical protein